MPITDEISKKICDHFNKNQHDKILACLRNQLDNKAATAQEIFAYARDYKVSKKDGEPYVINASTINKVGVVVSKLEEADQKKLTVEFYKLAAERGNSWGCRNYAQCLLNGSYEIDENPEEALNYAKKAVKLTEKTNEEHEHKFMLCKALRENKQWQAANTALMEYLVHKAQQPTSEKNKQEITAEIQKIIQLCKTIIEELHDDFLPENADDLSEKRCLSNLEEIEPILACDVTRDEFFLVKQDLYFIKGKCHEHLEEYPEAWLSYCTVKNINAEHYNDAITARKNLLKQQIDSMVNEGIAPTDADVGAEIPDADVQDRINVLLPVNFEKSWKEEATWFHSVETSGLQAEYNNRMEQVEKMIAAKEVEISICEQMCKSTTNTKPLSTKKESLEQELQDLSDSQKKLKKNYTQHTPEYRRTFRRHATESHFFNPARSKKKQQIAELAKEIVDHRYKLNDEAPSTIDLTGKSARLFISAEKIFQEAIIRLSGSETPRLGIPRVREKSWSSEYRSGTNGYGAVESYAVGESTMKSEHRTSPEPQRLGDSFLPDQGSYSSDIYWFLSKLSWGKAELEQKKAELEQKKAKNKQNLAELEQKLAEIEQKKAENEQRLAALMIRYGKNHTAVTLDELRGIYSDADENDVHHFHKVCFLLMEKEQAQWLSATNANYHLGMSVAQARCLIMIEAGHIGFEEAFNNNVLFGVYSCTGIVKNPSNVAAACKYIDKLYLAYLQTKHPQDHLKFFKKYIKDDHARTWVLTRKQARLDMQYVYGGEDDSDHEGYDTDLSM